MAKKYLPFIVLIISILLFFFIKKNQRGKLPEQSSLPINIPAVVNEGFNRKVHEIIYSKHARSRMQCRHIDESEVEEILEKGTVNYDKIEEDKKGKTFPLEGITHDHQHVRIVFAPKQTDVVVVTVIDLGKDWDCGDKNQQN